MDESKILKVLRSEIGIIFTIITVVVGIIVPYFQIRSDISLIQKDISIINTNHEAHIQDIMQRLKELAVEQKTQNDALIQLMTLERIK